MTLEWLQSVWLLAAKHHCHCSRVHRHSSVEALVMVVNLGVEVADEMIHELQHQLHAGHKYFSSVELHHSATNSTKLSL